MKNRLYDATKIDWDNLMFSTKELWMLLIPIMVEQMLNSLMGMADTMMVSNVGSVAMSAVSLVDSINTLVIQVFAALATGAAIICSHYLGKGDERGANKAARQIFLTVIVISLTITAGGLIFCRPLLRLIFGAVEPAVMEDSIIYFLITASSYPFIALFNAGGAFYRAGGNSKFPMKISIISNVLNIIGNAVLIFGCNMGVAGAAISTLVSRAFCAIGCFVFPSKTKTENRAEPISHNSAGFSADRESTCDRYSCRSGKWHVSVWKTCNPVHGFHPGNTGNCGAGDDGNF